VMQRMSQPGAKLMLNGNEMGSAQAARLYDPKKLQVRVDVPLANAGQVQIGQTAEIVVEVLRETKFKGRVTRIVHEADIQKNTLQVKVAIDDPKSELKPEMLARVQFLAMAAKGDQSAPKSQRLFVAESAIQRAGGNQAHAWIVDKGRGTAAHRMLTLGDTRLDGWIEVTSGLQPGDDVISGDVSAIKEGQKVKAIQQDGGTGGSEHGSH
jgi:HlyD family secretion protein